jgi:ABC-type Na+ efflux pump permease subunit
MNGSVNSVSTRTNSRPHRINHYNPDEKKQLRKQSKTKFEWIGDIATNAFCLTIVDIFLPAAKMNKPSGEQGNFLAEAQLALDDLGDDIVAIKQLSSRLNNPRDVSIAYLNIKSNGDKKFCIELSPNGYRVVGQQFDDKSQTTGNYYESLALLTNESKSYVDSFAKSLQQKLFAAQSKLQRDRGNDDDGDRIE